MVASQSNREVRMKALRTPAWIILGYQKHIKETEERIKQFRAAGYYGLVPEQNAILDSLKRTLASLIEMDQNIK